MNDQNLPVRREFGSTTQLHAVTETASTAVAAQAKAMVEARYIMAMQRPRNWDQVRQDLMLECRRPSFAHNKSTYYRKPIGQGVEGLGIRFVEVALRCMTNVLVESAMVYEDDLKEVHRVTVTDLESNLTYPLDVKVGKTVERSKPMDDGSYLSMRKNSYGKVTYTVPANDDDLLNKRAAQISKAVRTLGLRIIPGDLQDEAEAMIKKVRLDEAARDPAAERKKIVDAFGELNVKAADLIEYLGHALDSCSPQELVDLRGLYGAIRDGEATWKTVMDNKRGQESGEEGDDKKPDASDKPAPRRPAASRKPATPAAAEAEKGGDATAGAQPQATGTTTTAKAPESQTKLIRSKIEGLKQLKQDFSEADLLAEIGGTSVDDLTVDQGNLALELLQEWSANA